MPTPLRTSQTSGHSSYISNIPLWSLKSPPSHGSKIIIFHLSQSKCTVSALFLHGFKGCNGHSDLKNTTKGAEIAGRKITMLCTGRRVAEQPVLSADSKGTYLVFCTVGGLLLHGVLLAASLYFSDCSQKYIFMVLFSH